MLRNSWYKLWLLAYNISINSLQGKPINLSKFKGKHILFVNVASKCGFTPQYKTLQQLHGKYGDNIEIIGVPCNQFGGQEPGNVRDIETFCEVNYGVNFLITEKIDVNGENTDPIFSYLKTELPGTLGNSIKWNFTKFLIDTSRRLELIGIPSTSLGPNLL